MEFPIEPFRRHCLLNGLDDIGLTLAHDDRIAEYEQTHPASPNETTGGSRLAAHVMANDVSGKALAAG